MKKIVSFLFVFFIMLFPISSFALEKDENFEIVSITEKYYKTVTINNKNDYSALSLANNIHSFTEEVTKQEYEEAKEYNYSLLSSTSVETNYKKLTTTISSNGSYYRYKVTLNWKNIPKVRSYDTIAIGFNASVKPRSSIFFEQTYCPTSGDCRTLKTYYQQRFKTGVGATFKVPTGDLKSLNQTLYFDVEKAVNETIISQRASGDYAHAVKTVAVENAQKFGVSNSGIDFDSSVLSSFDEIPVAQATWSGSW